MYCRLILILLFLSPPAGNWELKKESDNILVYTRKSADSDLKELKCVTTIKTSLSAIVKMLIDVEHYPEWIFNCDKASLVKQISDTELYNYQVISAPWPVADRDLTCHLKVIQNSESKVVTVTSEAVSGLAPETADIVRVKKCRSVYTLTPLANGNIHIAFELSTDPGGNIPVWLVNSVIVKGPFSTQLMMNKILLSGKYKSVKLDYITEP